MLGYAEAATCRRRLLLGYFGEESLPCGNCDVCLSPPELWDATIPAQKALSAVVRTGQRFGAGHVIDVLAGRKTAKVESWEHHVLPTFGVGADLSDQEWRSVIRQLVARGVLHPDSSRMGALQLTDLAKPILDGSQRVELRRFSKPVSTKKPQAAGSRTAGSRSGGSRSAVASAATDEDRTLFEALRAERRALADAEGVPAFVVLPDRTLWELVATKPQTTEELLAVNGIGPVKAERYGAQFLALLAG